MAAVIAEAVGLARGLEDLKASSAGTSAWDGAPASDGALLVAMEHTLDLGHHSSRALTREMVQSADLILVMGPHHRERVLALGGEGKAHLLTEYATRGAAPTPIADPFGGDLDAYRAAFGELRTAVEAVVDRLLAERDLQQGD